MKEGSEGEKGEDNVMVIWKREVGEGRGQVDLKKKGKYRVRVRARVSEQE
jgi:hypothetical protein